MPVTKKYEIPVITMKITVGTETGQKLTKWSGYLKRGTAGNPHSAAFGSQQQAGPDGEVVFKPSGATLQSDELLWVELKVREAEYAVHLNYELGRPTEDLNVHFVLVEKKSKGVTRKKA